jgi:cellobiose-specific phosphotransferase system component IIA
MTQHDAGRAAARAVVRSGVEAAKSWDYAESSEEIAAGVESLDIAHLAARGCVEAVR